MKRRYWQRNKPHGWTWPAILSVLAIVLLIVGTITMSVVAMNYGYEPPDVRGTYPTKGVTPYR